MATKKVREVERSMLTKVDFGWADLVGLGLRLCYDL